LPPVISHDATAGRVSGAASLRWGLPEGALVSCGGGDNMMSAIGTGTLEDGLLAMSLGTSGTLFGHSDKPIVDPSVRLAAFCSSTGAWLPLLCTMNCTVASEQIRSLLSLGLEGFNALAESARPGAGGLVVLPFFNGERVPNLPHGRASVQGARADNFTAANLARAAMESAIFGMKAGLEAFTSQGFSAREIRLTGGGSKSRLWRQLTADIMGLPVRVPRVDEAAAMGAAFQAQFCLERSSLSAPEASRGSAPRGIVAIARDYLEAEESGLIHPDPEAAGYYERAYQSYVQYLEALSPLYR
ncbi:MAG TPA: FGGY-family carbohydrate kinase, partial [Rectinemataceae bacterium]